VYGWSESCCVQIDVKIYEIVLDTKDYRLNLNPICDNEEWDPMSYRDSDWDGDSETRISVTGFIIYLLGASICWRLKGQKGVTLSSIEAEYVAISEAVKEILFIHFLLKGMGVDIKLPIFVRCDNVGAIFMAENSSSEIRTRHIDIRYHFVREHVEYGLIKIVFVKSSISDADMFTKNVGKETYEKHVNKFLGKMQDSNLEYRG
jgi:hypothetical protein